MKKLLAFFLLAVVTTCVQAAQINWEIGGGAKTIKDSTGAKMTGMAYLILDTNLSSIESNLSNDISGFNNAMKDYALDSTSISNGKANPNSGTATHKNLVAGESYNFALLIFDSINNQYYMSGAVPQRAYDSTSQDASLALERSVSFTADETGATSGTNPSTQTFKPAVIPEPSVALMGLLGLGMLLKRRKA